MQIWWCSHASIAAARHVATGPARISKRPIRPSGQAGAKRLSFCLGVTAALRLRSQALPQRRSRCLARGGERRRQESEGSGGGAGKSVPTGEEPAWLFKMSRAEYLQMRIHKELLTSVSDLSDLELSVLGSVDLHEQPALLKELNNHGCRLFGVPRRHFVQRRIEPAGPVDRAKVSLLGDPEVLQYSIMPNKQRLDQLFTGRKQHQIFKTSRQAFVWAKIESSLHDCLHDLSDIAVFVLGHGAAKQEQAAMLPRLRQSEDIFESQRRFFIQQHLLQHAANLSAVDDATLTELPKLSGSEQEQKLAAASHVKSPSQQTADSMISEKVSNMDKASSSTTANSAVEDKASTTPAEASDAKPEAVETVKASMPETQASSSEKTKAAEATATQKVEEESEATASRTVETAERQQGQDPERKVDEAAPNSSSQKTEGAEEEAPMTSQDEASSPTKSSGSTPAKETVKPEAESDAKPSKTVETAKASSKSAASDSSSEKTEAADAEEEAPMTSQDEASSPTKSSGSTPAKETVKPEAESHAKPSKTVETVKASSKPAASASSSEKTKATDATAKQKVEAKAPKATAVDATAKPKDKEKASKPSKEKVSIQTKSSGRSRAEERATQEAEADTKASNAVAAGNTSSKPAAQASSAEKTKSATEATAKQKVEAKAPKATAVDATAKPKDKDEVSKPSQEKASSQTKSSGSSAKRDAATQKAENSAKRSKTVASGKAAKSRPAKEASPPKKPKADATAKQNVEKKMPRSQEAAAASSKGPPTVTSVEGEASTFAYSGSFEADVQKILAGAVLEDDISACRDSSSKDSVISEDDTPSRAARDNAKKGKAAEKKAQATEEHLESLIERKVNLIAVAVVGDLHRNGHIQTVLVAEVEKGRATVFVSEDLLKGSKAQKSLKVLLEAKEVVKVMHDCRMAADALQSLLGIQLCSVFDTAIAWQMLQDTDPSALSSTESTILPVLQKYAPLAFKEMHKVLPPQKKTLPKPEQAIFDVLGLRDEVTSTATAVEKHEAVRLLELKGLLTASLAMGKLLGGKSQTFKKLCQKGLAEFRAWPGQHVRTLPRGRKVPFSFKDHKLVCHLSGSEELRKKVLEVQREKEREAAEAAAEIQPLLRLLPDPIFEVVQRHIREIDSNPMEIVISVGRPLEFRWKPMGERVMRSDFLGEPATKENVQLVVQRIGLKKFTIQDRAGIDGTLHRISAARNQSGQVVTLIMRVGRASSNLAGLLEDILADSKSILMLGPPGVGKTTLLRACASTMSKTRPTVIVDPAGEIAGCGDQPHKAVGRALKDMAYSKGMKTRSEARREAMTRVLENMTPKVLVVDEIGTKGEAQAARTIGERGVQLVATAHGHNLSDLLSNTDLRDLAGGIMTSTVGDANERYKASGRKTVSERSCRPVFYTLIEIRSPISVAIHTDLARSVDVALMGQSLTVQVRSRDEEGQMWVEWQKM